MGQKMNNENNSNVKFLDRSTVFVGKNVKFGKNVVVYGNNYLDGDITVGDNVVLYPFNYVSDSVICENTTLKSSDITKSKIGANCSVGPYSRLRPNTVIGDNCKIGNFVEIKNSVIGSGCKISHLTYVGDATLGENCNVGCGVVFVNYNGKIKQRTVVGNNCFIGSNANVISPVNISDNVYICAGTTVTENCDSWDFVIGRERQINKRDLARKYLKD
ncbi:MAG: hypothetical protein E7369_04210 [Clostridiales bacterium]|nr:hypothetical protein [Clostridiales bacterium]